MLWPNVMSRDDVRLWGWAGCSSIIQRTPESGKAAPSSSVWDPSNCLKTFLLPDVEGICPGAAGLFSSDGEGVGLLQEGEPNQVRAPEIVSGKKVSKILSENLSRESPILVDLNCHVPFKFSYIFRKRCKADVWSGYIQIPWLSANSTHVWPLPSLSAPPTARWEDTRPQMWGQAPGWALLSELNGNGQPGGKLPTSCATPGFRGSQAGDRPACWQAKLKCAAISRQNCSFSLDSFIGTFICGCLVHFGNKLLLSGLSTSSHPCASQVFMFSLL